MDIIKYTGYFHDGYVNAVIHKKNNIDFFLESSVIDPNEIGDMDKAILSSSNTLKGVLSLHNIKNIKLGNKKYRGILQMQYDDGEILDLEIDNNKVFLYPRNLKSWEKPKILAKVFEASDKNNDVKDK